MKLFNKFNVLKICNEIKYHYFIEFCDCLYTIIIYPFFLIIKIFEQFQ